MKKKPVLPKTGWLLWDASDVYTGGTLWHTRKQAEDEWAFDTNRGSMPMDGKWKISKVRITEVK